jgi:hypothetical protein
MSSWIQEKGISPADLHIGFGAYFKDTQDFASRALNFIYPPKIYHRSTTRISPVPVNLYPGHTRAKRFTKYFTALKEECNIEDMCTLLPAGRLTMINVSLACA